METEKKHVTLRDIADACGTSAPTVSYVLGGSQERYVRAELRQSILDAAGRMGYVSRAERLSAAAGKRIAIVSPQFENIFFRRMMAGAEQVALRDGFVMAAYNSHDQFARETEILHSFAQEKYAGFLMVPNAEGRVDTDAIAELGIPYVVAERPLPCEGEYDFVSMDNFDAGYQATRALTEAGHRHIGLIGWETRAITLLDRHLGYARALDEAHVLYRPEYVRNGLFSEETGYELTRALLESQPSLTALVLAYHVPGLGGVRYLMEKGIRVPQDISVVLIGDPTWAGMTQPAYERVALPAEQVGRRAAEILMKRILSGRQGGKEREIVPGGMIRGGSIRRL